MWEDKTIRNGEAHQWSIMRILFRYKTSLGMQSSLDRQSGYSNHGNF